MPVLKGLLEVRGLVRFIEVDFSEALNGHVEMVGDFRHVALGDKHSLWAAEASKSGIRDGVCLCDSSTDMNIGKFIASVDVCKCAIDDSATEILTPTSICKDICIESLELSIFVDSNFPARKERMTLTRRNDIVVSIQHAAHRSFGFLSSHGADTCKLYRTSFFTTKPTA